MGRVLPRSGRDPAAAAALLEDLADRALRSEFEPVICLEAPEAAQVPRDLLRADGAPRLTRAQAAHALGADLLRLEGALAGPALDTDVQSTGAGLREDQAAALAVLADGRRVSVINAPAGSGKTRSWPRSPASGSRAGET